MITFNNWEIACPDHFLAHQHDNLSHQIRVVGEVPTDYAWEALLQVEWNFDILPMQFDADGLYCDLTAGHLATEGHYQLQLRGTRGEEVKHTNQIRVYVPGSLSGDTVWPEIPSAFKKYEARLNDAADKAEQAVEDVRDGIEKISESQAAAEEAAAAADRRAADAFYYMGESNQLMQGTAELKHQADASASNAKAYADGGDIVAPNPEGGFKVLETVPGVKGYMEQAETSAEAAAASLALALDALAAASQIEENVTASVEAAKNSETGAAVSEGKAKVYAEGGILRDENGTINAAYLGAMDYRDQAQVYTEGGETPVNPHKAMSSAMISSSGAKNYADKAKAYTEGGSYQEFTPGGRDEAGTWAEHTVEKGAKQYAEEAAECVEHIQEVSESTQQAVENADTAAQAAADHEAEAAVSEHNAEVWAVGGELEPHENQIVIPAILPGAKGYAEQAERFATAAAESKNAAQDSAASAAASAKAAEDAAAQTPKSAVAYTEQTLTAAQQAQARANIGAAAITELAGAGVGAPGEGEGAEVFNDPERNSAAGDYAHAEGLNTSAEGDFAHAEGVGAAAHGSGSHVEGYGTVARGVGAHVQGRYNADDTDERYAHIVGNGRATARSNAHTVDWDGNAWFAGKVFVGGTGQDDPNAVELGVGGDCDWNKMKNRPFGYEGTGETLAFIPETRVYCDGTGTGDFGPAPEPLQAGVTYVVHVYQSSGTTEVPCVAAVSASTSTVCLNGAFVSTEDGSQQEFVIRSDVDDPTHLFLSGSLWVNRDPTIKIEKVDRIVQTIDPVFLPEDVGGGVKHWDDLEGRPFGDSVPFVVLAETTIETDGLFGDVTGVEISLEPGKSYTVTWNGAVYECICYESDGEFLLGNGQGVWAEDTGEPFLIHWYLGSLRVEAIDGSVSVTLSISTKVLETLDNKYLGILEKTSSDTLTWPGDTEGRVSSSDGQFYKVSDAIVREEDTVNGATVVVNGKELTIPGGAQMVTPGVFVHIADDYPDFPDVVYHVQEEAVGTDVAGFSFPEAGVYFRYEGGPVSSLTLPGYTGFVEEKIKRKHLPDSLFTGDQSASVGGAAALEILAESGVLTPAYENGTFYTDAGTTVYIL